MDIGARRFYNKLLGKVVDKVNTNIRLIIHQPFFLALGIFNGIS